MCNDTNELYKQYKKAAAFTGLSPVTFEKFSERLNLKFYDPLDWLNSASNSAAFFVLNHLKESTKGMMKVEDVYNEYLAYNRKNEIPPKEDMAIHRFGRLLTARYGASRICRVNGKLARCYNVDVDR